MVIYYIYMYMFMIVYVEIMCFISLYSAQNAHTVPATAPLENSLGVEMLGIVPCWRYPSKIVIIGPRITICQPSVNMKKNGRNVVPPASWASLLVSWSSQCKGHRKRGTPYENKACLDFNQSWISLDQLNHNSITSHALLPSHLWQGPVHTKCLGRTAMTLSWIVQWAIPQPGINKPSPITVRLQYYNHSWSCWQILASDQWLDESNRSLHSTAINWSGVKLHAFAGKMSTAAERRASQKLES